MSQQNQPEMLSGGAMLVRALHDEGVEYVYGYPGGAVLHIYDALFQQNDVKHVLVRHEQAATHMADAYARASGKAGVVLVTSGPGATNAVTGIATAYMDSIPMVVICGQVMSHLIGDDAFQDFVLVYHRDTTNVEFAHDGFSISNLRVDIQGDWIKNHPCLRTLYFPHLGSLLLDGHVFMNKAQSTLKCNGNS